MKFKNAICRRTIKERYSRIYQIGYCAAHNLFAFTSPDYYNAGVYGWNFDLYAIDGAAFLTGYRNMIGVKIPYSVVKKYDDIAAGIRCEIIDYKAREAALYDNYLAFIAEIESL